MFWRIVSKNAPNFFRQPASFTRLTRAKPDSRLSFSWDVDEFDGGGGKSSRKKRPIRYKLFPLRRLRFTQPPPRAPTVRLDEFDPRLLQHSFDRRDRI